MVFILLQALAIDSAKRVVSPGYSIQVGEMQLHIATAVYMEDFPAKSGFNLFLNGWIRMNASTSFRCCLMTSLPEKTVVDVAAYSYHTYAQFEVDMQNAEFSCSVSKPQMESLGMNHFTYVTFAEDTCFEKPFHVMKITFPKRVKNSVAICPKIIYGPLDPQKLLEWFEYNREMGVTKVFAYNSEVSPDAMRVLDYYRKIGFLETYTIHPAVKDGKI